MFRKLGGLLAVGALTLSGCGNQAADSADSNLEEAPVALTVGVVPVADVAPLYLGIEKGFFEEENLEITLQNTQGAAAAVPLLLNGELELAYGAFNPVISVAASGVPVIYVTGGIERPGSPDEDYSAIITAKDSAVKSLVDLPGKRIAVNALRGGPHLSILLALEAEGVDPDSVEFVELPMGEGIAATERGDVDAAYLAEPFTSQATKAGLPIISSPVYETAPKGATSGYFTIQQYLTEHPDVVDAFTRALTRSVDYANANPDAVREKISEYSGMEPDAVADLRLPTFTVDLSTSSLETMSGELHDFGWIDSEPDVSSMVRE